MCDEIQKQLLYFTKNANPSFTKPSLKFNVGVAKLPLQA